MGEECSQRSFHSGRDGQSDGILSSVRESRNYLIKRFSSRTVCLSDSWADFQSRQDILKSVGVLLELVGHKKPSILAALRNLHTYFSGRHLGVERALKERLGAAEAKVMSSPKWQGGKDTSFLSVKGIVKKPRTTAQDLKSISLPLKTFFNEPVPDSQGQEQKCQTVSDVVCCGRWGQVVRSDCQVISTQGIDLGNLDKRATKGSGKILVELRQAVANLADLLHDVVSEMEMLRGLMDNTKNEQDQRMQAGFIKLRKRFVPQPLF
jgi:hypothetical protein